MDAVPSAGGGVQPARRLPAELAGERFRGAGTNDAARRERDGAGHRAVGGIESHPMSHREATVTGSAQPCERQQHGPDARVTATLDNEKNVTELTIAPDGRVFAFGTSRPILEVLEALRPDDRRVGALLAH